MGAATLHVVLTTVSMEDKSPLSRRGNPGSVPVSPIQYVVFNQLVSAVPLPVESIHSLNGERNRKRWHHCGFTDSTLQNGKGIGKGELVYFGKHLPLKF